MINIVVVDDEESIRNSICDILEDEGYNCDVAANRAELLKIINSKRINIAMVDVWLGDENGLDILDMLRKDYTGIEVIMISGHANIKMAVEAIKRGAYDFVEKPLSIDKILNVIEHAREHQELKMENEYLRALIKTPNMVGTSKAIEQIKSLIVSAARSNARVFITGENGSGKELVARLIHLNSNRKNKPFVAINCAAIPETLIEGELFGYEKGAFTGAVSSKKGKFELADGGTIFLDEIGDMSVSLQAKLLRVLQEMEIERLGSEKKIKIDVRVIAATNKDINEEIKQGNFREDLFYRLNVIPIHIPPLRERKEDIPLLVKYFIDEIATQTSIPRKDITEEALNRLMDYPWYGNVRELKNIVERLMIIAPKDIIQEEDVEIALNMGNRIETKSNTDIFKFGGTLKEARAMFEREYIKVRLTEFGNNITNTAKALGIERSHLHKKIKELGIKV